METQVYIWQLLTLSMLCALVLVLAWGIYKSNRASTYKTMVIQLSDYIKKREGMDAVKFE